MCSRGNVIGLSLILSTSRGSRTPSEHFLLPWERRASALNNQHSMQIIWRKSTSAHTESTDFSVPTDTPRDKRKNRFTRINSFCGNNLKPRWKTSDDWAYFLAGLPTGYGKSLTFKHFIISAQSCPHKSRGNQIWDFVWLNQELITWNAIQWEFQNTPQWTSSKYSSKCSTKKLSQKNSVRRFSKKAETENRRKKNR